jgi:hypothetical protein
MHEDLDYSVVHSPTDDTICTSFAVPLAAAWEILTCREGAQLWLADQRRGAVEVGTRIPIRGVGTGTVIAITPRDRIELRLDDGSRAQLEFRAKGETSSELTLTRDGVANAPEFGWRHLLEAARIIVDRANDGRNPRQAIVVIHGIGSQRPLATATRFTDALVDRNERWTKPDRLSSSYELRRYQLERTRRRPRTDIYELYWADKVPGTTVGHLARWLRGQLVRRPRDVSPALRPIVYVCFGALALAVAALIVLILTIGLHGVSGLWQAATGIAGLSLVTGVASGVLVKSVGDAARYLDDAPDNIAVRQSIREAGVTLLRRLHTEEGYHRVVIVGHSLGSVIAYDLIRQYWSEVHTQHGWPSAPSQRSLKAYVADVGAATPDDQKALWEENRRLGMPWLITDLVTLGSPLTHATSLLARSRDDLEARRREFQLPTCPPHPEGSGFTLPFSYVVDGRRLTVQLLTHGCPFASTRWTNLYAPVRGFFLGDLVGGPVAPVLGAGIADVSVRVPSRWRRWTTLAHTAYWRRGGSGRDSPVPALLSAIDLDSRPWLDRHVRELPWTVTLRAAAPTLRKHLGP